MVNVRPLTSDERLAFNGALVNTLETVPYFAAALFRLHPVAADNLGTFAVDKEWRLYLDMAVLADWGPQAAGAVLAHEVSHVLRDHHGRREARGTVDHQAWGIATDTAINEALYAADVPLPGEPPTPDRLQLPANLTEEEYYDLLKPPTVSPANATTGSGSAPTPGTPNGDPGGPEVEDGCGSGAGDPAAPWELASDDPTAPALSVVQQQIARRNVAADIRDSAAKNPGTVPAGLVRWADAELTPPTIDWRRQLSATLRRAITYVATGRQDFTYSRPGRRRLPQIVTPAMHSPKPVVSVIVDTSGSMSQDDLTDALSEIAGIAKATRAAMTILSVDTNATVQTNITRASQVILTGGGGTDMRVGIAAAQQQRPRPDLLVLLTDGFTPYPTTPTPQRLIVGLVGTQPPPTPAWATRLRIGANATS